MIFLAVVTFGGLGLLLNLCYMIKNGDILLETGKMGTKRENRYVNQNISDSGIQPVLMDDDILDDSFYDDRFDDVNPNLPDLFIEQEESINETIPEKYLLYNESFVYPLEIDLELLVNNVVFFKQRIPYRHINPHPYTYIHLPPKCKFRLEYKDKQTIIVLIKSAVHNLELRTAIRAMWRHMKDPLVIRVFMLGYNGSYQALVDEEVRQYNDIVQENFIDAYMNNTLKTIMSYNWAVKYCVTADMLFFLDDDYHVRLQEVFTYIRSIGKKQPTGVYIGTAAMDALPERNLASKWRLSFYEYPFDRFPPYIGGGAYLVSKDVARKFKVGFPYVKYLGIDDVYLGIVAKKLGVEAKYDAHFSSTSIISLAKECSHDPSELVTGNCQIADRKRRILLTTTIKPPLPNLKLSVNNESFEYPLMINMTELVEDKLKHNKYPKVKPINPHRFVYLHRPNKCSFVQSDSTAKNILLLYKSNPSNVEERLYMRKLWGVSRDFNLKKVFLLGLGKAKHTLVNEESRKYRDILQEDFHDTYMNSTLKTIMGFNWASKFCPQADYLVVVKEGHMVDLNKTLVYLRTVLPDKQSSGIFRGKMVQNALPTRDKESRLYLSREWYPMDAFPPFVNEIFFVLSADVAWKFQVAFPYIEYFGRSDIYLGFVARKLNIKPRNDRIFADPPKLEPIQECPDPAIAKILTKDCVSTKDLLKPTKALPEKITVIRRGKLNKSLTSSFSDIKST